MEKFKATKYSEDCIKENLVEVITEYRNADVVVGGKIFMSAEDAKSILMLTNINYNQDLDQCDEVLYKRNEVLYQCREILRSMAKQVLYQPSDIDANLINIIQKYK